MGRGWHHSFRRRQVLASQGGTQAGSHSYANTFPVNGTRQVLVAFHSSITGQTIQINAAVASTPQTRAVGFSNRRAIGPNEAIFFAFPTDVTTPFTMANTFVPLDMIFLDSKGTIVHVAHRATPLSAQPYASPYPYRYVIEVPGGWLDAHGLTSKSGVGWSPNAITSQIY